jgi:hypothetical protein
LFPRWENGACKADYEGLAFLILDGRTADGDTFWDLYTKDTVASNVTPLMHCQTRIDVPFCPSYDQSIYVLSQRGIISRLAPDGTPMARVDIETCRCFLDPAETQKGPDPSCEIEKEEAEVSISI